ncbi:MAG: Phosphomevalonate kinase [Gammaproteobacteria bacterium]|nr:Phosphomevalonate kinase [Gammaproteobacteria bacterium]
MPTGSRCASGGGCVIKAIASAPGKVAILGEYAVLEGAPALVMAVNRRARVTIQAHLHSYCSVAAPAWGGQQERFELGPDGPRWATGGERTFKLPAHIIQAFFGSERWSPPWPPFHATLDSASLVESGSAGPNKLGLGSSAALTVALCKALSYYAAMHQYSAPAPELTRLIDIHSGFQRRRGSGLDVAASLYGGLIEYRRAPAPLVRPSRLPEDIEYCFVWSGQQAVTGEFLASIDTWRKGNAQRYRQVMKPLAEIARAGIRAAHTNDNVGFLRSLDEYVTALHALGRASGTDILSEPHQRLRSLAKQCGVIYKPCGAGGGDIGVGMSRNSQSLSQFEERLASESFRPLSLKIDETGVETQSGN